MKKYYGIEKDGQLGITVDNKVVEAKGKLSDGKAYVAYDVVRDYINSRFYWDSNENVLLYMLPKDMISVDVGSKDYSVSREKKSEDYVILKQKETQHISRWILSSSTPILIMKCQVIRIM